MNEAIKHYADRAGFAVTSLQEVVNGEPNEHLAVLDIFAQTIINKCAELADRPTTLPELTYGDLIRNHFGLNNE
jgi:hypothetical protein